LPVLVELVDVGAQEPQEEAVPLVEVRAAGAEEKQSALVALRCRQAHHDPVLDATENLGVHTGVAPLRRL
jgi:hypothetical protein